MMVIRGVSEVLTIEMDDSIIEPELRIQVLLSLILLEKLAQAKFFKVTK